MSDPVVVENPALDLFSGSRTIAAENFKKLIIKTIEDVGFDLYSFAHLMQQELEGNNPLHSLFEGNIVRSAKIYVRASDLFTEAVTNEMANQIPPEEETTEIQELIEEAGDHLGLPESANLDDNPPWND